jgi:aminopeptidase N
MSLSIKKALIFTFSFGIFNCSFLISPAQPLSNKKGFTRQDTLRGTITPERAWWNVLRYDVAVTPDYAQKTISGVSTITFSALKTGKIMQVDLQEPLIIDSAKIRIATGLPGTRGHLPEFGALVSVSNIRKDSNAYFIQLTREPALFMEHELTVYYHGKPREAVRPPWDGGWIWKKDEQGRPWMSVACQGLGASVWYPCKDHQSDEPDKGASLSITIPDSLTAVANGRLQNKTSHGNGTTTWKWAVVNPINNYNLIPYIGKYVTWHEDFAGEKGKLDCDYWVLDYNLEKAKAQFKQAPQMLKCFEYWFGPYPFYEDGYKLVEAPHLGMEHQSAVAYGNGYLNGYRGRDLSGSGWGEKWDFIIVHESGHEWFANNITTNDIADMWVHEGFTNYSETMFTTCLFGTEAGNDYVIGTRKLIQNDIPIIGIYGVNQEGSGDMYYKGGNLLHTIRQLINNDSTFRQILRGLNKTFYHKTVTTKQIEAYISGQARKDFSKVFDQYLRTTNIPVLQYKLKDHTLEYRYTNCIKGFAMPLKVTIKGTRWPTKTSYSGERWITPTEKWQQLPLLPEGDSAFTVNRNFYIQTKKVIE